MRKRKIPGLLTASALLLLVGCATQRPPSTCAPGDPDLTVTDLHSAWLAAPACTLHSGAPPSACGGEVRSRAFLRRQAQNLSFRHPTHVPTRMLLAAMAYEADDPVDATRHLDYLLRLQPSHPEAAILRSRIALEAGNAQHALEVLNSQVRLRPDHAGLREALASAHFMARDYAAANTALDAAEGLGGRADRIAYNRGLVAEESGDFESAKQFYREAESKSPGWSRPTERLAGLLGAGPSEASTASVSGMPVLPPPDFPPAAPALPPVPAATLR